MTDEILSELLKNLRVREIENVDFENKTARLSCEDLDIDTILKIDPENKFFKPEPMLVSLWIKDSDIVNISVHQSDSDVIPVPPETSRAIISSYRYKIEGYDKDADKHYLCGLTDDEQTAKTMVMQAYEYECQRKDTDREARNVPDIDKVCVVRTEDGSVLGWRGWDTKGEFEYNNHEFLLTVNATDAKNDLFVETVGILSKICGEDFEQLDIRRKENLAFIIPDRYVWEVSQYIRHNGSEELKKYSTLDSYNYWDTSLIVSGKPLDVPYVLNKKEIEMPVEISTRCLLPRLNPLNAIPEDKLNETDFYVRFTRHLLQDITTSALLRAEFSKDGEKFIREIPLSKNEQEHFRKEADEMLKSMDLDKMFKHSPARYEKEND